MRRRAARLVWRAVRIVVAAVLAVFLAAALVMGIGALRAHNGVTTLFGHPVLVVLSGSMKPVFDPGDVVIDRSLAKGEASHLEVGEIITFHEPGSSPASGTLVTHRIVSVAGGSSAARGVPNPPVAYQTRGDNNNMADPWTVTPSDVVAVYQRRIPDLGYLFQALHRPLVVIVAIVVACIWVGEGEFRKRWHRAGTPATSEHQSARHRAGGRTDDLTD